MFFWYDPTYWLLIPGLLLAIYAQVRVSSTFGKWQQQMSSTGLTGAQIARQILDANGAGDVRIEPVAGKLTDHYDPRSNTIRLSQSVYCLIVIRSGPHAAFLMTSMDER